MATNYQIEPIFYKHLPPPNIIHNQPHHTSIIPPTMEQLYEQKFQSFMNNQHQQQAKEMPPPIAHQPKTKLNEIKQDLMQIIESIKQLKTNENDLRQNINEIPTDKWIESINNLHEKQKSIELLLAKYENQSTLKMIKKTTSSRQKKRLQLKRIQVQRLENKVNAENYRKQLHQQIDLWQSKRIANEMKIKDKKQKAERVPQILGGVTKKKLEAKKYLAMLESLIELRRVRRIQSGKMSQIGENHFIEQINRLKTVWNDALENYENDENELKKFLDNNEETIESDWNRVLFGACSDANNAKNPLFKANYCLDEFISMRKMWDSCIVPESHPIGTTIPLGWVMPNSNPNDQWVVYQQK